MIVHSFDPVLIDLGLFQIRWYSIAYILGIIVGWYYAIKIIKLTNKNQISFQQIESYHLNDLIIYLVIGIILGGRLGYIFFYNIGYYSNNILEMFKIWQGGMSFHGGLLGLILSVIIFSKKTNTNFFKLTDVIACVAPIGIFLGRIANFINGELYGKISTVPWAIIFPSGGSAPRHPSQIYEAILEGIVLLLLINYLAFKKKLIFRIGYISGIFLVLYSILRIISEIFREPDAHLGIYFNYFSMGTLLSIITLIFGFLILIFISKQNEQNN